MTRYLKVSGMNIQNLQSSYNKTELVGTLR